MDSPLQKSKSKTGQQKRREQTDLALAIPQFLDELYKTDSPHNPFYHGFNFDHKITMTQSLFSWQKDSKLAHEYFGLKLDNEGSWPTVGDIFPRSQLDKFDGILPKRGEFPPSSSGEIPKPPQSGKNQQSTRGGGGLERLAESQKDIAKAQLNMAKAKVGQLLPEHITIQLKNTDTQYSTIIAVPSGKGLTLLSGVWENAAIGDNQVFDWSDPIFDALSSYPPRKEVALQLVTEGEVASTWNKNQMGSILVDSVFAIKDKKENFIRMNVAAIPAAGSETSSRRRRFH